MEKSFETHDWRHELPKDNELHAFLTIKLWDKGKGRKGQKKKKRNSDSFQNSWEVYADTVENAEGALWLACQTMFLSFSPLGDLRPKAL